MIHNWNLPAKIRHLILALATAAIFSPSLSFAQATASFSPTALPTNMSVTTATGRIVFPSAGPSALIINLGSTSAYLNFGNSAVTATTGGYLLQGGCATLFDVSGRNYLAAITASGSTNLLVTTGTGLETLSPVGCGIGGGGAAVTVNQGNPNTNPNGSWFFLPDFAISTGYVQLTSLASAVGFSVPANTTFCIVIPGVAPLNYRSDGVNPTASVGEPLAVGQAASFRMSAANLGALRFIQQSSGGVANIDCYKDF